MGVYCARPELVVADAKTLTPHLHTGHLRARERRRPLRYATPSSPPPLLTPLSRPQAREFQSRACKAIWDFKGIYATSRHVPGVRFAGTAHPGLIGTAPSAELLATWNAREGALLAAHAGAVPPVAGQQRGDVVIQPTPLPPSQAPRQ